MSELIVYFSRIGQNYVNDAIKSLELVFIEKKC